MLAIKVEKIMNNNLKLKTSKSKTSDACERSRKGFAKSENGLFRKGPDKNLLVTAIKADKICLKSNMKR